MRGAVGYRVRSAAGSPSAWRGGVAECVAWRATEYCEVVGSRAVANHFADLEAHLLAHFADLEVHPLAHLLAYAADLEARPLHRCTGAPTERCSDPTAAITLLTRDRTT